MIQNHACFWSYSALYTCLDPHAPSRHQQIPMTALRHKAGGIVEGWRGQMLLTQTAVLKAETWVGDRLTVFLLARFLYFLLSAAVFLWSPTHTCQWRLIFPYFRGSAPLLFSIKIQFPSGVNHHLQRACFCIPTRTSGYPALSVSQPTSQEEFSTRKSSLKIRCCLANFIFTSKRRFEPQGKRRLCSKPHRLEPS